MLAWLALAAAFSVLATPSSASGVVELLSHRASYRLDLLSSDQRAGIAAVQGGLVVEWRDSCEGWVSNQRLGFVATTDEGPGFSYDVRFSSWESRDRQSLRFTMRSFDGDDLTEESRGSARLDAPGGQGSVQFSAPETKRIDLPPGTIFPTEHLLLLIEAARAGQHFVVHDVFDGSGLDGLNRITAVIADAQPARDSSGPPERRWRVNLAYYTAEKDSTLPDFALSFAMSEQGVIRDVVLDYGEFSLKGELEKLEPLPGETCP